MMRYIFPLFSHEIQTTLVIKMPKLMSESPNDDMKPTKFGLQLRTTDIGAKEVTRDKK